MPTSNILLPLSHTIFAYFPFLLVWQLFSIQSHYFLTVFWSPVSMHDIQNFCLSHEFNYTLSIYQYKMLYIWLSQDDAVTRDFFNILGNFVYNVTLFVCSLGPLPLASVNIHIIFNVMMKSDEEKTLIWSKKITQ